MDMVKKLDVLKLEKTKRQPIGFKKAHIDHERHAKKNKNKWVIVFGCVCINNIVKLFKQLLEPFIIIKIN